MRNWRGVLMVFGFILFLVALPTEKRKEEAAAKAASLAAYPTYCLGGWENPGNAAGEPNLSEGDDSFSGSNSALLDKKSAQIFCGYFQSNDKSYPPKTVTLKFSWKMIFENQPVQPPASNANTNTDEDLWASVISGTSTAASTTTSSATSTPEAPIEPASTPTSTATSSEPVTADNNASSTEATTTTPDVITPPVPPIAPEIPSSTESSSTTSLWNIFVRKVFAQSEPLSQSFLNVSYNLENGKNWQSAGQVTEANWRGFSISIPVASWDDIEKLQVQLTPVLSVDMPTIYLDGMRLEVNYDQSLIDLVNQGVEAVSDAASNVSDAMNSALDAVADAVNSVFEPDTTATPTPDIKVLPPSRLAFSMRTSLPVYMKELPWKPPTDGKNDDRRTGSVPPPTVTNAGDQNSFKVEGACAQEYFTVLLFRNENDYANDPSSAIFNKAFRCVNGNFSQTFTDKDFSPNLADGNYYLVTGDQGTKGTWQPHSSIQIININRNAAPTSINP
jgi:hypothetical protein